MKWIATPNFSSNRYYEIQEDLPAGYYLYIYEDKRCICDYLQDSLDLAMEQAKEDFGVSQELWRKIEE